jgi:hypothetical protein
VIDIYSPRQLLLIRVRNSPLFNRIHFLACTAESAGEGIIKGKKVPKDREGTFLEASANERDHCREGGKGLQYPHTNQPASVKK